ncbi:ribbon-helix-helix domain-containing protein [Agromyces bauzanensis]|uniref:ribbon-helix-helix domain-containing protein n=1 Tax=Agromyces bauzanensis TaxID=1308924 RepID=UPI00166821A0|nr:ribbon-helix-helix domain-containing protein [Agromyces bauzanensis]
MSLDVVGDGFERLLSPADGVGTIEAARKVESTVYTVRIGAPLEEFVARYASWAPGSYFGLTDLGGQVFLWSTTRYAFDSGLRGVVGLHPVADRPQTTFSLPWGSWVSAGESTAAADQPVTFEVRAANIVGIVAMVGVIAAAAVGLGWPAASTRIVPPPRAPSLPPPHTHEDPGQRPHGGHDPDSHVAWTSALAIAGDRSSVGGVRHTRTVDEPLRVDDRRDGLDDHPRDADELQEEPMNTRERRHFELPASPEVESVETEEVIYHGEPLTDERVRQIVEDVRRANLIPGGKSLNRDGSHSRRLSLRLQDELFLALEHAADESHVSVSKFTRAVLEEWAERRRAAL